VRRERKLLFFTAADVKTSLFFDFVFMIL
jgi:hypothetical protein